MAAESNRDAEESSLAWVEASSPAPGAASSLDEAATLDEPSMCHFPA